MTSREKALHAVLVVAAEDWTPLRQVQLEVAAIFPAAPLHEQRTISREIVEDLISNSFVDPFCGLLPPMQVEADKFIKAMHTVSAWEEHSGSGDVWCIAATEAGEKRAFS